MEKNNNSDDQTNLSQQEENEDKQKEQSNPVSEASNSDDHNNISESMTDYSDSKISASLLPFLIATAATIVFYFVVLQQINPGSFLDRLFNPEGGNLFVVVVPVLIFFFFLWSVIDLFLIFLNVRKENSVLLSNSKNHRSFDQMNGHLEKIIGDWKGSKKNKTYFIFLSLTESISKAKNAQSVHDLYRYQSEINAEKAVTKYTLAKIAVWAMPILGFIGTVLGISMAVGNFSGFLTQDIDNIDLVKGELSKVATGLSFAFDTTLFGLVMSLIAMFISTFIQNFEQKFLTKLEETGKKIIENSNIEEVLNIQNIQPAANPVEMIEEFNKQVDEKIKQVAEVVSGILEELGRSSTSISSEFGKLPPQVDEQVSKLTTQLATTSENIISQFNELPDKMSSNADILINSFENISKSIAAEFEKIPKNVEDSNAQLITTFNLVNERLEEMKNGFSEISLNSEKFYNGDLAPVLNEMRETLAALHPILETLTKPTEIIVTTKK